jgi:hypothetical protein
MTTCEITLTDPAYNTEIHLPLTFDYIWVPQDTDRIELAVKIASDVMGNEVSLWQGSARDLRDDVLALASTVTTLEFYDNVPGTTAWDVFVESVDVSDTDEVGGAGQIDRVATIKLRRL